MTKAFTLIEIMVSAIIISVVVATMLQLFSNNSAYFSTFDKKLDITWTSTLLLGSNDVGFEDKTAELKTFVSGTDMRMDFVQYLDDTEAKISYKQIMLIDSMDLQENIEDATQQEKQTSEGDVTSQGINLEIGKTIFNVDDASTYILRIKSQ